ncbi:MAG TPA: hypothetical protein PKY77_02235 [Phycisphaerae bacterium]|nr:hypothetical protein [Phycisphaerae bacterium]HRY66561.1 hypothetical protein [Phycisphaerae bacterium]HSA26981.1 hypothetical protein [Phycisphaerae bacterium]
MSSLPLAHRGRFVAAIVILCGWASPVVAQATSATKPTGTSPARDELRVDSIEGMPVSLQPAKDRALLVLLLDTRDAKSDEAAKAAVMLYRRFHAHGLDAVGVYADKSEDPVFTFSERWQLPWPQVMDKAGDQPKPSERLHLDKPPSCRLIPAKGKPIPLKLEDESGMHEAVAGLLGVSLERAPMPEKVVAKVMKDPQQAANPLAMLLAFGEETDVSKNPEKAADQIGRTLAEDGGTQIGSLIVEWLYPATDGEIADVIKATMAKLPPRDQVRLASGVMQRAPDGIECVLPYVAKVDYGDSVIAKMSRWDRSQCGRALVLAGELVKGRKLLRTIAEQSDSKETAWWYVVGWADLLDGQADSAKEALCKAYREDGDYNGTAAKVSGDVAAFLLGEIDEAALLRAQPKKLARFFIAERHLLAGDRDKARQDYRRCVRLYSDPRDPSPCNWANLRLKQLDDKLPGLPKALPPEARLWTKPGDSAATQSAPAR